MQGFLIWGAFTVVVAAFCVWRPHPARIFVGLFFGVMGLGVHGGLIFTNPQGYVDFAAGAPWAIYRGIGTSLTEPSPLAFGIFMLTFETVTAALILSRGRAVKWGLLAAIVFLIGITPLGLEEVPNLILAAGMAFLLTQDFPTDVWSMLHRHRRPELTPAVRGATSPRAHGSIPEMTTRPPQRAPRRSEVAPPPQPHAESLGRTLGADRGHGQSPPPPTPATEAR
jgi:hypothetical protein